ncbi:MAG: hypothetical protein AVDCRST_MAG93-5043, partial [uncultured Chloroflexia bacterium]
MNHGVRASQNNESLALAYKIPVLMLAPPIRGALLQLYPSTLTARQARHLTTLAALISGIVGSRQTQLPAIASKLPDRAKRESRVKRFQRWLTNASVTPERYFLPFAAALLQSLAHGPLVLVIDGSTVGRGCLALVVSP